MKTSKFYNWIALCTGALMLMGCPYSSTVPLSDAGIKVADNLIGKWEQPEDAGVSIEIKRSGPNSVTVVKTEAGYEGGEPTISNYEAFLTDINGTIFLNVREVSEYEGSYYFYKLIRDGDFKLTIFPVTDNVRETFDNSEMMKKFFAANMQNSYFFNTGEETYYKVK